MPAVLTDAQKEAKRARDAAYRARKAAEKVVESESLGPVVNPDGSPTDVTLAMFGKTPVVVEDTEIAFKVRKGKSAEGPVTGLQLVVVQKYRDGARLLTGDGRQIKRDATCEHIKDFPAGYVGVAFEVVGGPLNGTHGWVHRVRGCNRPYSIA